MKIKSSALMENYPVSQTPVRDIMILSGRRPLFKEESMIRKAFISRQTLNTQRQTRRRKQACRVEEYLSEPRRRVEEKV